MNIKNIILLVVSVSVIILLVWLSGKEAPVKKDLIPLTDTAINTTTMPIINATTTEQLVTSTKTMSTAIFTTNKGVITLELFDDKAPKTVENFKKLAGEGFYNGTRFHRVIQGFMIQGGDPLSKDLAKQGAWGTGGPGYSFADEIHTENQNIIGTIAMANAGPNTNGSQFFINTANNSFLNTKHTVFGKVTGGMDVVTAIEQTKTGQNDRPLEDVIIEKIEIK
ncbi:MAG: peptidylprolyl isomerase [Patescibacteria group bacterium]